jgi:hypothetical protein
VLSCARARNARGNPNDSAPLALYPWNRQRPRNDSHAVPRRDNNSPINAVLSVHAAMRDYLLEAQASVDWAISQFPSFKDRLGSWLDENIEIVIRDVPAPATHNPIVAVEKDDLPLSFSAESGCYFNAIRSALDILACAIGKREMVLNPDNIYFPVANSADDFARGNYRGSEFVRQLSRSSREIIENFKPYDGGNKFIWACHRLDIVRKHKRLLDAYVRPRSSHVTGWGLSEIFTPLATGFVAVPANRETILGLLLKGAQAPQIQYTPHICLNESSAGLSGYPVIEALHLCAWEVRKIIEAFDC